MSATPGPDGEFDKVLVVDFGAQYAQLIARRVREANVYSEIISPRSTAAEIAAKAHRHHLQRRPRFRARRRRIAIDPAVYDLDIPILGICYGAQLIAQQNGGTVGRTDRGEYGRTVLTVEGDGGTLLSGTPTQQNVWMSHFDAITVPPDGVTPTASTPDAPVAAFESANASSTACSSTRKSCTPSTASM